MEKKKEKMKSAKSSA